MYDGWHNVKCGELPDEPGDYIVLYGFNDCKWLYPEVRSYNNQGFYHDGVAGNHVIWWRRIPTFPDGVDVHSWHS